MQRQSTYSRRPCAEAERARPGLELHLTNYPLGLVSSRQGPEVRRKVWVRHLGVQRRWMIPGRGGMVAERGQKSP